MGAGELISFVSSNPIALLIIQRRHPRHRRCAVLDRGRADPGTAGIGTALVGPGG
jgi:hypothetical protein